MTTKPRPVVADATTIAVTGIRIPGATPDGIDAQLLNIDFDRGIVATIIHITPGAGIPAHFHENGSEAHYVLEGDLVDGGRSYAPGAYLTHAAGVVHGPHTSVGGRRVLTIQGARINADDPDFHVIGDEASGKPEAQSAGTAPSTVPSPNEDAAPPSAEVPPDMAHEPVPGEELLESQKVAPADDNPINPNSG